jgi:hypothetical protein
VPSRVRQLHLRFDAGDLGDPKAGGLLRGVVEKRRLADARLAADDEDGALARAGVGDLSIQQCALADRRRNPGRRSAAIGAHR